MLLVAMPQEAEGLCSRIGILVDGRLACLGSPDHLKHRYGRGYQIEVSLAAAGGAGHEDELAAGLQRVTQLLQECGTLRVGRYALET
jgi:ABC-type multidrug transport system ATPase subunit